MVKSSAVKEPKTQKCRLCEKDKPLVEFKVLRGGRSRVCNQCALTKHRAAMRVRSQWPI
jgi:hypothetical protein